MTTPPSEKPLIGFTSGRSNFGIDGVDTFKTPPVENCGTEKCGSYGASNGTIPPSLNVGIDSFGTSNRPPSENPLLFASEALF